MEKVIETVRKTVLKNASKNIRKRISKFKFVKCPDQFVASMTIFGEELPSVKFDKKVEIKNHKKNGKGSDYYYNRISVDDYITDKSNDIIIVVLESPHKDEYFKDGNEKVAIGPAYGKTGDNFNKFFPLLLRNAIIDGKIKLNSEHYEIIFMNAIQYQCSLGDKPSKYRDEFFMKCWENDACKDDFKDRLKKYLSIGKERVVINCCTTGKKNLQKMVHNEIQKICKGIPTYLCAHPCCWFVPDIHS